jgi:hypothetical protein
MVKKESYLALLAEAVDESGADALLKTVPYAKHVYAAYQWNQRRRIGAFLRSLNRTVDDLPHEDRQQFDRFINSNEGGELLADFSDHVIRTRSQTAIAVLAILYGTPSSEIDDDTKARIALAMGGISEGSLDVFLTLSDSRHELAPTDAELIMLSNEHVEGNPSLRARGWFPHVWVVAIDDLVARGLLGRDLTSGGWMTSELAEWHRTFRFTAESAQVADLIQKGRNYLRNSSVVV